MSIVMLAHDYHKHYKKVRYPVYVQPKLNGIRCLYKSGVFWSRTGKRIKGMPKLLIEVSAIVGDLDLSLDGELFCLGMPFQEIASSVNRSVNVAENTDICFHVFDMINMDCAEDRVYNLSRIRDMVKKGSRIKVVDTHVCLNREAVAIKVKDYISKGYEGGIIRALHGVYETKRSYNLLKYKEFKDIEATCTGFIEGKGRLRGTLGAIIGKLKTGVSVNVGSGLADVDRAQIWGNTKKYLGKKFTIKFQEYSTDKVPIFPVFIAWRDYE